MTDTDPPKGRRTVHQRGGDYVNADHVVADYLPEALVRDIGGRAISDALDIDVAPGANRAKDLRLKKWLRVLPRLEVRP